MHKNHTSFFGSNLSICVTQKQGTFEDQDLIIVEVKKSMIGKRILHMGRVQAKLSLGCWQVQFVSCCL